MNMQYKWAPTALDDESLPAAIPFEIGEMRRPAAAPGSILGAIAGVSITTASPPMPAEQVKPVEPKVNPVQALSAKIKEAMQTDYDAEESLAAIRAILVGPTRRLQDARIEEIISILEEMDRSNQDRFRTLEDRCETVSSKVDIEIEKATASHMQHLTEFSFALDSRFNRAQADWKAQLAGYAQESRMAITQMSQDFTVQFREQERKVTGGFETLTQRFEERFLKMDEDADELQQRSAEVFAEGLNDIAKRLTALRRSGK
jgi:hypothetical protein